MAQAVAHSSRLSRRATRPCAAIAAPASPHLQTPVRRRVGVPAACFLAGAQDDPELYGLTVDGTCLAPVINDGDLIIASPTAPIADGDYVVIWGASERPLVKRIVGALPRPYAPGSDVQPCLRAEQLNPPKKYLFPVDRIRAVHRVIGWAGAASLIELAAPVRPHALGRG